jgi:hypothetical protein
MHMPRIFLRFSVALAAVGWIAAGPSAALAQTKPLVTKPVVTGLGPVAVMMDCSQCPIHPRLKPVFTEFAKKDSDIVRAHGATPVFFMSSPVGNTYLAGIDEPTARFPQTVAWETVRDYYQK